MEYETFKKGGVTFEIRGKRGDWGLFVVEIPLHDHWDGYLDHYPTKSDAKWFAAQYAKSEKE